MTGRACNRALTGTFEVDVVFVCEGQEVVTGVAFDGFDVGAFAVAKGDFDAKSAVSHSERRWRRDDKVSDREWIAAGGRCMSSKEWQSVARQHEVVKELTTSGQFGSDTRQVRRQVKRGRPVRKVEKASS